MGAKSRRRRRGGTALAAAMALVWLASGPAGAGAGTGWRVVRTPVAPAGTTQTIGGMVTFGATEVWAIGQSSSPSYAGCHGRTLTLRYDGTAFVEVPDSHTPICASVEGVAGTSTSDIWAVGSTNNGRDTHIRHWNGSDWSVVPGATIDVPPSGGRAQRTTGLNAVAALGPSDAWAVGRAEYSDFSRRALAEHWDGLAWSLVPVSAEPTSALNAVVAPGNGDVWAVGKGPGTSGTATLVERWHGSSWQAVPSPNVDVQNTLRGITAVSPSDMWAVGDAAPSYSDGFSASRTLIEHWDGSSWSVVKSPNVGTGNNSLAAVVARSASDAWAVGYYDDVTGDIPVRQTLTMHWDGSRWSVVRSRNLGDGDNMLSDVVAATTGPVWASGGSAAGPLVERFS